jgi:Lamin Tail Domain/IPT/TIG domain
MCRFKRLACLCLFLASAVSSPARGPIIRSLELSQPEPDPGLVINEYLADPPEGPAGDANGDGLRDSTQDEFVEIVNVTSEPLPVGGFTISDAAQVRFTFPQGTMLPTGEATVIFGGGIPVGPFGNASANHLVFAIGGAGLSLNNGGDSIIVRDNTGVEAARRDYPAGDGSLNQSVTRSPDITGPFAPHSSVPGSGGRLFSPGTLASGRPFVSDDPVLLGLSPESVVAGAGSVPITLTGNKFQNESRVLFDGAPLETLFIDPTELRVELPSSITQVARSYAVTVANPDGAISNTLTFTVLAQIGINEFLADPPDGPAGDANQDGIRDSSQDEFVEVVNRTAGPFDVSGISLSDAGQVRFSFPPGTSIPAGEAAVVFGGGHPQGDFGNAGLNGLVFTAALSLNNGGDSITLKNAAGQVIESIAFGSPEGNANQSVNRDPDILGVEFKAHASVSGSAGLFSPGARVDGSTFTIGPRITGITPVSALRNTQPFSLTVSGNGFEPGSAVQIDSHAVTTIVQDSRTLIANVPSTVVNAPGIHPVVVRNPGGNRSNAATLVIIALPPAIRSVSPSFVPAGIGQVGLTIRGTDFDTSSRVAIDDEIVPSQTIGDSLILTTVPPAFTSEKGTHSVMIRNGDGQTSNRASFEVGNPGPFVESLSPDSVLTGSPELRLSIRGASFRPAAIVLFNHAILPTQFVSSGELTTTVEATLLAEPGTRAVAVQNDDGALSNERAFSVLPISPIIREANPGSAIEGSNDLAIRLSGERFKRGVIVRKIDTPGVGPVLATLFLSDRELQVTIPARFMAKAGPVLLRVENPDRGVSGDFRFEVVIKDPLVVNEFLADPADGSAGDANGDGTRSSAGDEFVEIVNRTSQPIDISGYRLSDSDSVRHIFPKGTVVPPFEAAVVFGGGKPTGRFGNVAANKLVFTASSGGLSLNNGGDRIKLEDASGGVLQDIVFGQREGGANQSINRSPDFDGATFGLHTLVAKDQTLLFSPGQTAFGKPFTTLPSIADLSPDRRAVGSDAFTLGVRGSDFLPGAEVLFSDTALPTRHLSNTMIEADVETAQLLAGGAADVRVRNPRGEISLPARFLIVDAPPRIDSMTPDVTGTGAENLEVQLTGERFQRGAVVMAAGQRVDTRVADSAHCTAVLPTSLFVRPGVVMLVLENGDGNTSNRVRLLVENGPLITRLLPRRIRAGRGEVEFTIGGLAFDPQLVIYASDVALETIVTSETRLTCVMPAALTGSPGEIVLQGRAANGGRSNHAVVKVVP